MQEPDMGINVVQQEAILAFTRPIFSTGLKLPVDSSHSWPQAQRLVFTSAPFRCETGWVKGYTGKHAMRCGTTPRSMDVCFRGSGAWPKTDDSNL
jgi:hypothetical protein